MRRKTMKMRQFLLCCTIAIAMLPELCAQVAFGSPKDILPTNNDISYVYTMDVDGDGDNDFIAQFYNEYGLYWYEQTSTQDSFALPKLLPNILISHNEELQLDDVDGDGDLDIITCGLGNNISYNEGNGNFTEAHGYIPGARSLYFDYDNDGDKDLIVYTISLDYWSIDLHERVDDNGVVFNPGVPLFGQGTSNPDPLEHKGIHAVVPWDIDNDGDKDLLVAAKFPDLYWTPGSNAFWIINDGIYNSFISFYGVQEFGGIVEQLEVAEDGNSEQFLVATVGSPYAFTGEVSLKIIAPPQMGTPLIPYFEDYGPYTIEIFDLDGDGDDDIITNSINNIWLEQTSGFWITHNQNIPAPFSANVPGYFLQKIADYNLDGIPDKILTPGSGDGRQSSIVYYGGNQEEIIGLIPGSAGGDVFGPARSLYPSTATKANGVIDIDADGDVDILGWEGKWLKDSFIYIMENVADSIHFPKQLIDFPGYVEDIQFTDNDSIGFALVDAIRYEGGNAIPEFFDQVYMIQKDGSTNTGWSTPSLVIDSIHFFKDFELADMDGDGDEDLLFMRVLELDYMQADWYENTGPGTLFTEYELANDPYQGAGSYTVHKYEVIDINNDGLPDIFLRGPDTYAFYLQQPGVVFDFSQPSLIIDDGVYWIGYLGLDDYDSDGDPDILERRNLEDESYDVLGIYRYNTNTQQFDDFEILQELYNYGTNKLFDVDADGDTDVFTTRDGVCLNIAGAGIFSAPTGVDEPNYPKQIRYIAQTLDVNGDGTTDIVTQDWNNGLQWQENFTTSEFTFVQGTVFYDADTLCQDIVTDTLPYTDLQPKIQWQNSYNNSEVISTNNEANYLIALPDTGQHIWNLIPPSAVWQSCPEDTIQTYTVYDSVYTLDFQLQPLVNCPYIDVSMMVGLLRGCEDGIIYLNYQNTGTLPSQNQVLNFTHESGLTIVSTSIPPLAQTDTLISFELPTLDVGASGQIQIVVNANCAVYLPGHVFCFDAVVEQDISCIDNLDDWDGSDLRAEATCEQDSIVFTLRNEGPGAMATPRQYSLSIVNDDIIMLRVDDVLLEPEDSILLKVKDTTELIRLIAAQDDGHPIYEELRMTVDGCITSDTSNLLNQQLLQSPNTNYGLTGIQVCRELRGAYDPNIKEAFPLGEGADHELPAGSWIDYTVHFQNTGNDTAFLVVLRDTLPGCLDLTTLRMGASSHPYEWILHENRELSITFDPIALPDSNVNVSGSQGFVHYSIKIPDDCLPGTEIKNRAGIYFDFNPVVLTEYTHHTIHKPVVYSSEEVIYCLESGPAIADSLETITYSYPYYDSLVLVQHKFIVPDTSFSMLEVTSGTIWDDIEIVTDTTISWIIANEYGCDSVIIYEFNIVSIQELELAKLFAYPNPASEQVFVSIPGFNAGYHLELYEARGSLVWRGEHRRAHAGAHEVMIPVEELPDGIYNLRLKGDQGQQVSTRVVVRR